MKFFALLVLLSVFATVASACDYVLKSTQLLQCRPIKLLDGAGADHQPAWTYIDDSTTPNGVLAHMFCVCNAVLAHPNPLCASTQTHKLTFTLPTNDILKTCAAKESLCQDPCEQLINQ